MAGNLESLKQEMKQSIIKIVRFLYDHQVIAADIQVKLEDRQEKQVEYGFIRKKPGPFSILLKREKDHLFLKAKKDTDWFGPVKVNQPFRLLPEVGVRDPNLGQGGITFIYRGINSEGELILQSFDMGGIFDYHLNIEAIAFEPQVAGTYYADAYSAYAFAWMAEQGYGKNYKEAAAMALDFVQRIYPEYAPVKLDAFGHSDFKNPVYMETVEQFMKKWVEDSRYQGWKSLFPQLVNTEGYSPTNVYALRYCWWAMRNYYIESTSDNDKTIPQEYFEKVRLDQKSDGLLMDNNHSKEFYGGYVDSHDLTYHLYGLSWLIKGYEYYPMEQVMESILKAAQFSLSLTTSAGECSYIGRSANNVYHMICALFNFLFAAKQNNALAGQFYRASRLIWNYLKPYQQSDGSFPVGLNDYPEERLGWSHCQSPYNASNAYFLIQALNQIQDNIAEEPLELEKTGWVFYPDARYAAYNNNHYYCVLFSGCDLSPYPHSGVHNTGIAGLAALGLPYQTSLLPILEQSLREGEWSTSELPDIIDESGKIHIPVDQGRLIKNNNTLELHMEYGGFSVRQIYEMEQHNIRIKTRLSCIHPGKYKLVGAPGLSCRVDKGYHFNTKQNKVIATGLDGKLILSLDDHSIHTGQWETMDPSTTGRGYHQKVAWVVEQSFEEKETINYTFTLDLLPTSKIWMQISQFIRGLFSFGFIKNLSRISPGVPSFMLKKLYQKGSLKQREQGIGFTIQNNLLSVTVTRLNQLKVDNQELSAKTVLIYENNEWKASQINEKNPIAFEKGKTVDILVQGISLSSGKHKMIVGIEVKDVGPLNIEFMDEIHSFRVGH